MPRYKPIHTGMKFLPIDLSVQLLPGNFEHALSHLRIPGIGREEGEKSRKPIHTRHRKANSAAHRKQITRKPNSPQRSQVPVDEAGRAKK